MLEDEGSKDCNIKGGMIIMSELSNGYCNSKRPNSDSHSNLNNLYKFCKNFGLKDRANEFLKERDKTPVNFLPSPTATLHIKSPMLKEIMFKTEKLNENHIHNILGSIGMPLPKKYTRTDDDHHATYVFNYLRKHCSLHSKEHIKGKHYHSYDQNDSDNDSGFYITPAKLKKKVKHKQQKNKKDNHNKHKPKSNTPKVA